MAFAACLKGWFIAKQKVAITSSASLFEQIIKIVVTAVFLNVIFSETDDIGTLCKGIVMGVTVSEMCSFTYLFPKDGYDIEVDTHKMTADECAEKIVERMN